MRGPQAGVTVILTLIAGALLVLLVSSVIQAWRMQKTLTEKDLSLQRAQEAARAGLAQACLDLALDPTWTAGCSSSPSRLAASGARYEVSFAARPSPYSVNNVRGTAGHPVIGYRRRVIPPGCADLISQGWCDARTMAEEALVWVMPRVRGAISAQGRVAVRGASTPGIRVDSWDSRRGPYEPGLARSRGHLLSNHGPVDMAGATNVRGSIILGPGATLTPATPDSVRFYEGRAVEPLPCAFTVVPPAYPPQDPPPHSPLVMDASPRAPLLPGSYGTLATTGTNLTLTSGLYRFTRITTAGSCTFRFDTSGGPVVIHIDGPAESDLSHATLVNPSREARKVLIVGTERATGSIRLAAGGDQACAVVWAPTAHVILKSDVPRARDFFGALGGATVTIEGSAFLHYDESLEVPPVVTRALQRIPPGGGQGGS